MKQQANYSSFRNKLPCILILCALFSLLVSCYDLNIFRIAQDIDKRISLANDTSFYFLLDDKDVSHYLRYNKKKRDALISKYLNKGNDKDATGQESVLNYLNTIKLLFRTTEISDVSFIFFIDIYQELISTGDDIKINSFSNIVYKNIKGESEGYVSNFVDYSILLHKVFNLLGEEFSKGEKFPDSKDGFEITKFAFAEVAIMSSIFDFLYRFHRVLAIDLAGNIVKKNPICKEGETEAACEIADTDPVEYENDYRNTLIKYLSNFKEYKDIFSLQITDFAHVTPAPTAVPSINIKNYLFNTVFLYDNNVLNPTGTNYIENVIAECGLQTLLDEIKDL